MIDLYSWSTPNGHKIHIALEELGLAYRVHGIDIGNGEQFHPDFLKIGPNNKVPVLIDAAGPDGVSLALMESGAILFYLAEKTGRLMPEDIHGRARVMEWLMFQMANVGPMLGQTHHFRHYASEPIPYAIQRYTNEATRLYRVLDDRLREVEFLVGGDYSIADIATFPWIRSWERQGRDLSVHAYLKRWFNGIADRPAVKLGLQVLAGKTRQQPMSASCSVPSNSTGGLKGACLRHLTGNK